MRLGILDIGSNTVHLLIADADAGARPMPAADHRWDSPLLHRARHGEITDKGQCELLDAIREAQARAAELGVAEIAAFATSALRDAANVDVVLERVRNDCGLDLHVLDGDDEARLTFLAARRWFGWGSGRLLLVDIGGGSLELAVGSDETPDHVASMALGAARLTRDFFAGDRQVAADVESLREHVSACIAERLRPFRSGEADLAAGTSKTLRALARIAGAPASSDGLYVPRFLRDSDAEALIDKLAGLSVKERAKLPGVSTRRAPQLLAGAVVAAATMQLLGIDQLRICPWALREGVILTRQDWIVRV